MSADKWFMVTMLGVGIMFLVFIISHTSGFKVGYESCMRDAVENNCAIIAVTDGNIKYQWKIPTTATAESK